ncbi:metal-dependent phosphohydrolase [Pelomyxa schiedti]|nr:metal-dependent phosphohydrolase [Pelomyxa schiedti]
MTAVGGAVLTGEECRKLWVEYDMLPNIQDHSETVCRVATTIVSRLRDPALRAKLGPTTEAGALLHDITKTRSLKTGEDHPLTAGTLLRSRGLEELAHIVEQHVDIFDFDPSGPLLPAEIVCYSDKRVTHDKVVTLEERRLDLVKRYCRHPSDHALMAKRFAVYEAIQAKITSLLGDGQNLDSF